VSNTPRCPVRFHQRLACRTVHANRPIRGVCPPRRHRSDRCPTSKTVPRFDVTWNSDGLLTPSIVQSCPAVVWYRPLQTPGVPAGQQATGIAVGSCPQPALPRRLGPWPRLGKPPAVVSVIAHLAGVAPTAGSPASSGSRFSDNRHWLPSTRAPVVRRSDPTQTRLPRRQRHAASHMVDGFREGLPLRPCPVNRGIPVAAGALRWSQACDKNDLGRAALLSGIEKQAGPR